MTMTAVFSPLRGAVIGMCNRIVMAPLTRNQAGRADDVPQVMHVDHRRQRAMAGLIIIEATQITPEGTGHAWAPGIHSVAQSRDGRR